MRTSADSTLRFEFGSFRASVSRAGKSWATATSLMACFLLALVPHARAQILVDCDTPDDFCTGDPCVTPDQIEVTVASCVLDFGSRALVIADSVTVPNDGTLSLTAGSIEVQRKIKGRHTDPGAGDGADVSLIASGNIIIGKPVDVSARATNGSILVDAGGNVELRQLLRARGLGAAATATGGNVTVNAGGAVTSTIRGKIDARGRSGDTVGGQVSIDATDGVDLASRIDVRGSTGGSISILSSNGDVVLAQKIRATGAPDSGGSVMIDAAGNITGSFKARVDASGKFGNIGLITFTAAGTIDVHSLYARGSGDGTGGSISLIAGTVSARTISVRGKPLGGTINVESTVGDVFLRKLDAKASQDAGGSISVTSAANLAIDGSASVQGDVTGGEMHFVANGDMTIDGGSFDARGDTGGTIEGQAGGDLTADAHFKAEVGGCIGLAAGGTLDTSGSSFDVPLSGSCP